MQKAQKLLIVGNWKMNPVTIAEAKTRFQSIKKAAAAHPSLSVVVCPPFPFISALAAMVGGVSAKKNSSSNSNSNRKGVAVGAQDLSLFDDGSSQTGDVGAHMIESTGAGYVILGHSERRALGDTGQVISKKIQQALKTDMNIIVCFGEKERDADGGYLEVIKAQLREVVAGISKAQFQRIILAYEPVWAIGRTDNVALTSYDLHQMVIFVRKTLREMFGDVISTLIPILYGGSVTPENAEDIIHNGEVDGLLVGRASWQAASFSAIFNAINGGSKGTTKLALKETLRKAKQNKAEMYNKRQQERVMVRKAAKPVKKAAKKTLARTKPMKTSAKKSEKKSVKKIKNSKHAASKKIKRTKRGKSKR